MYFYLARSNRTIYKDGFPLIPRKYFSWNFLYSQSGSKTNMQNNLFHFGEILDISPPLPPPISYTYTFLPCSKIK